MSQNKKVLELIRGLEKLDLVKNPKNKAEAAELKQAIALLKVKAEQGLILDSDDQKFLEFFDRVVRKYPSIPLNQHLKLFIESLLAKPEKPSSKFR